MKIKVTYLGQRKVSVVVDVQDADLIKEFKKLGDWKSDSEIESSDPRWKIEELAYDKLQGGDIYEDDCFETIVDRKMEVFKD